MLQHGLPSIIQLKGRILEHLERPPQSKQKMHVARSMTLNNVPEAEFGWRPNSYGSCGSRYPTLDLRPTQETWAELIISLWWTYTPGFGSNGKVAWPTEIFRLKRSTTALCTGLQGAADHCRPESIFSPWPLSIADDRCLGMFGICSSHLPEKSYFVL